MSLTAALRPPQIDELGAFTRAAGGKGCKRSLIVARHEILKAGRLCSHQIERHLPDGLVTHDNGFSGSKNSLKGRPAIS